jgi:uncharacterized protein YndB with AHSA1/START domain
MSEPPTYVLERTFDAPRELVWKGWTDPALLARWYGPNVETIVHRLDLKSGGLLLIEMRRGGQSSYQRGEYIEIAPLERLIWLHSNADADWHIARNPRMPDWPRVLMTTVTLDEDGAQTRMRLTWAPHEASDAEIACFAAAIEGMGKGWNAGMELLTKVLAELQTQS